MKNKRYLFLNENQALDFIRFKASVEFKQSPCGVTLEPKIKNNTGLNIGIEFGGDVYKMLQHGFTLEH